MQQHQQQHDSSSSSMASLEEAINRKELQFAAICALVGIAALYVAVPRSVGSFFFPNTQAHSLLFFLFLL
jgi:hypothetical protein